MALFSYWVGRDIMSHVVLMESTYVYIKLFLVINWINILGLILFLKIIFIFCVDLYNKLYLIKIKLNIFPGHWVHWNTRVEEYIYPSEFTPEYSSILVPNVDNVRTDFLTQTIAKQGKVWLPVRVISIISKH